MVLDVAHVSRVCGIKSYCLLALVRIQKPVWIRTGADTGVATGVVKIRTVNSVKRKRSANCLCFPAKGNFLLKRASEGAPFWCDIKISCLLLSL